MVSAMKQAFRVFSGAVVYDFTAYAKDFKLYLKSMGKLLRNDKLGLSQ